MRPVDRGSTPKDDGGQAKEFSKYQDAKPDLIKRMGYYCSYCEIQPSSCLAVEHVKPKKHHPDLELQWSNLLLACANCNRTKFDKDVNLGNYYWPDKDNTIRVIEYLEDGIVRANPSLSPAQHALAEATIKLTGLDSPFTGSDRRLFKRSETWDIAKEELQDLQIKDSPDRRMKIVRFAKAVGFWSVWMTVFRDCPDMRRRFIKAFPGTSQECFDGDCNAIPRPGGAI